jgi:hypothetical protein
MITESGPDNIPLRVARAFAANEGVSPQISSSRSISMQLSSRLRPYLQRSVIRRGRASCRSCARMVQSICAAD